MNNKKKNVTTNTTPGTIPKKSRILESRAANTLQTKEIAKSATAGTSKQASKQPLKANKPTNKSNKSVDTNKYTNTKHNPKMYQNLPSESAIRDNDPGKNKMKVIRAAKSMSHSNITAYAQKSNIKPEKCGVMERMSVKSLPDNAKINHMSTNTNIGNALTKEANIVSHDSEKVVSTRQVSKTSFPDSTMISHIPTGTNASNALTEEVNIVPHESRKLDFKRQAIALMTSLFPDNKTTHISEKKDTKDKETQTISQDYAIEVPMSEKQTLITTDSNHIIETSIPINGATIRLSIQIPKEKSQLELHQQLHEVKSDIADMKLILNNLKSDMQSQESLEHNLLKLAILENEIRYVTITNNENEDIEEAGIEQIGVVDTTSETNKIDTANLKVTTCKVNKTIKTIQINSGEVNDKEQKEKKEQKHKEDVTSVRIKEGKCKAGVAKNTINSVEQEIYPLDLVVTRKAKEIEISAARTKILENEEMKGVMSAIREKNKADGHLKKALLSDKITVTKEEKKQCRMEFGATNEENKNAIAITEKVIGNAMTLTQNPRKLKKIEETRKTVLTQEQKKNITHTIITKQKIEEAKGGTKAVVKRNEELEGAVGFTLDDEASVNFGNVLDGMVFVKGSNAIHFSKDPNNEKIHYHEIQIDRHERERRVTDVSLPDISQVTQEKSEKYVAEVTRIDRIRRELNSFLDAHDATYIEYHLTTKRNNGQDLIQPSMQSEHNIQMKKEDDKKRYYGANKIVERNIDLEKQNQFYNGKHLYYVNILNQNDDDDVKHEIILRIEPPISLLGPCKPVEELQRTPMGIKSLIIQNKSKKSSPEKKKSKRKEGNRLIKSIFEN